MADGHGGGDGRSSGLQRALTAVVLAGLGVLLAVAGYTIYSVVWGSPQVAAEVGGRAPELSLKTLEGQDLRLSDFRGRPVLLSFRTTWCGYCQQEAPELQSAHETMPDLSIVGVYVDETPAEVSGYVQSAGLTFPATLDAGGESAQLYGVRGIPMSFILNPDGVITAIHRGPLTVAAVRSYLAGAD